MVTKKRSIRKVSKKINQKNSGKTNLTGNSSNKFGSNKFYFKDKEFKLFLILFTITIILASMNLAQAKGYFIPDLSDILFEEDNSIKLNNMTLQQKVAQMIITHGGVHNLEYWQKMQLGGVHFFAMDSEETFIDTISDFQEGMNIPFFVTVDLEGCLNPFANYRNFTITSNITNLEESTAKGFEEGQYLSSLGFNLNFAPVVDLEDNIWKCRTFPGEKEEVTELAGAYVAALESEGVLSTIKHYPGKTLVTLDPHENLVVAEITENDLYPYNQLLSYGTTGQGLPSLVMVSHLIVSGAINSEGYPSSVSPNVIYNFKNNYDGLVISDEINMLGLLSYYEDKDQLYVDLVLAGHDIILNFDEDPNEIYHMIEVIEQAILEGEISEDRIDNSVRKILRKKGFEVNG
ncbi:hypothetical protein HN448_03260 [archaeon]|nr:hypothetical protein [archaeon]